MTSNIKQCRYKRILAGFAIVASLVAGVLFSGCDSIVGGSYCDDKNGHQLFSKLFKEFLLKRDKDLAKYIDKVDFSYEVDEAKSMKDKEQKFALCTIKNIKLKFDTKDTMTISGEFGDKFKNFMNLAGAFGGRYGLGDELDSLTSRFAYVVTYTKDSKKNDIIKIEIPFFSNILANNPVFGDLFGLFDDIPESIKNYYDGTGVLINGKKKGACPNGVRQERDKNGEISFEGGCENGTKEGAWKYYDNGFLAKEELYKNGELKTKTEYYPTTGITKSAFAKDDKGNATLREYDEKGNIEKFVPFSTNEQGKLVVNGKMFNAKGFSSRYGSESLSKYSIAKAPERITIRSNGFTYEPDFYYVEVSNGMFFYGLGEEKSYSWSGRVKIPEVTTEQEAFAAIFEANNKPHYGEYILLGNLSLLTRENGRYLSFLKNDQLIGSVYGVSSDLCTTGQCQVMYKELINKSIYKDKIYSTLESAKPE